MKKNKEADVAVIGAGIVGLALAYTAAKQGLSVVLFERNTQAVGASIRNFGLIWPIGQTPGQAYEQALRSRQVWVELAERAGFWKNESGSLHLAYRADELDVLREFAETSRQQGYSCALLSAGEISKRSKAVKTQGLLGGLWSDTEVTVDPRQAIQKLPGYLAEQHGVTLRYNKAISCIDMPYLEAGDENWRVQEVYVCSGADFETLYPEVFSQSGITKCKLQMMRTAPQPGNWLLGPALCAGLTLRHYAAFRHCASLATLDERVRRESPEFDKWGIHVLLSQNGLGELVIGDSHEYGLTPMPFDREEIDKTILKYLNTFATFPSGAVAARWHGIYPRLEGKTEFIAHPEKGVTIVNGLGGAGMTLSFGLAQEILTSVV